MDHRLHATTGPEDRTVMLDREEVVRLCGHEDGGWAARGTRMQQYFVKSGTVDVREVENQREALRLIDPSIGRVPRIHDYFSKDGIDYLVMDFVQGQHPNRVCRDTPAFLNIVRLVNHMHSLTRSRPGPIGRRCCSGLLWGQDEDSRFMFADTQELESLINSRMTDESRIDLSGTHAVFTHGDLAPRNIIVSPDGEIWLLDWASAAYLPRSAEIAALYMQNLSDQTDSDFVHDLAAAVQQERPLTPAETLQVDRWQHFAFNNLSYCWPTPEERRLRQEYKAAQRAKSSNTKSRFGEIAKDHPAYALLNSVR